MKFQEFYEKLAICIPVIIANGLSPNDVDVMITKSSGETLFCLLHNDKVIDYFKVI